MLSSLVSSPPFTRCRRARRVPTPSISRFRTGAAAGRPVLLQSHVHIHVVPRVAGDLENNDEIYDKIATWSPEGEPTVPPPFYVPSDEERKPRTAEQMAEEARKYAAHAAHERIAWRLYGENGVGGEPLPDAPFQFGNFMLDASQLFYSSKLSVATVNLKPLCPGHVLCPSGTCRGWPI